MPLVLTNTLGGRKEAFEPLEPGRIRMYHCGPTVKEPVDLGRYRSYLLADVLRRHLERSGYSVRQVMNITDVGHLNEFEEDVIEVAAARTGLQSWELTDREEEHFHRERRALRILDAHEYPRAREQVIAMIDMIRALEARGVCYKAGGNLYLDIRKHERFGELSGKTLPELTELQKSSRTPGHPEKCHPLDIDLWRTDALHQMGWESPWGRGFPGWHVECAAMCRRYLGETFDVHSGTQENIFPHHECEIAQAEALSGKPMARYWLHTAPVLLDGRPMTREHRVTLRELLEAGLRAPVLRVALLETPYREPLDFGEPALARARKAVNGLLGWREYLVVAARSSPGEPGTAAAGTTGRREPPHWIAETEERFRAALDDDLDYGTALAAVVEASERLDPDEIGDPRRALEAVESWDRVLGIF